MSKFAFFLNKVKVILTNIWPFFTDDDGPALVRNFDADEDDLNDVEIEDDDLDLHNALKKARKMKQKKDVAEKILEDVKVEIKKEDDDIYNGSEFIPTFAEEENEFKPPSGKAITNTC